MRHLPDSPGSHPAHDGGDAILDEVKRLLARRSTGTHTARWMAPTLPP